MIEQFIQTIGTYPVGTLVELTSGEIAIVYEQNPVRRLLPKVVVVLDADKQPIDSADVRDLMLDAENSSGDTVSIANSLDPGTHGVDPADYYL